MIHNAMVNSAISLMILILVQEKYAKIDFKMEKIKKELNQ